MKLIGADLMIGHRKPWLGRRTIGFIRLGLIGAAVGLLSTRGLADDSADTRLEYMRDLLSKIQVRIGEEGNARAIGAPSQPILRFGDATRQTSDGVLWAFGKGRPAAIVAMEMVVDAEGQQNVNYEFLCLTDSRLVVRAGENWVWTPRQSEMQLKKLPTHVSVPAVDSLRRRVMKRLAKQFKVSEKLGEEGFHLRLMPNPIMQYTIEGAHPESGAVFAFANGTNPEALLFLETNQGQWQYGLARMCGAAPTALLDRQVVWTRPPMNEVGKGWTLSYTGDAHPVDWGQ